MALEGAGEERSYSQRLRKVTESPSDLNKKYRIFSKRTLVRATILIWNDPVSRLFNMANDLENNPNLL